MIFRVLFQQTNKQTNCDPDTVTVEMVFTRGLFTNDKINITQLFSELVLDMSFILLFHVFLFSI